MRKPVKVLLSIEDETVATHIIGLMRTCKGVIVQEIKDVLEQSTLSKEILGKAIQAVQPLFWGQSSHAITYCVARDLFNYDPNVTQYEEDVASLASQVKLDYPCPANTIATSIYNNPYQRYHVDKWPSLHVKPRCIKLAEAFRNEVKRLLEIENL